MEPWCEGARFGGFSRSSVNFSSTRSRPNRATPAGRGSFHETENPWWSVFRRTDRKLRSSADFVQRVDIGQPPMEPVQVEAVADKELVGDREADVAER